MCFLLVDVSSSHESVQGTIKGVYISTLHNVKAPIVESCKIYTEDVSSSAGCKLHVCTHSSQFSKSRYSKVQSTYSQSYTESQ